MLSIDSPDRHAHTFQRAVLGHAAKRGAQLRVPLYLPGRWGLALGVEERRFARAPQLPCT